MALAAIVMPSAVVPVFAEDGVMLLHWYRRVRADCIFRRTVTGGLGIVTGNFDGTSVWVSSHI